MVTIVFDCDDTGWKIENDLIYNERTNSFDDLNELTLVLGKMSSFTITIMHLTKDIWGTSTSYSLFRYLNDYVQKEKTMSLEDFLIKRFVE